MTFDDWALFVWERVVAAGHESCGGWSHDAREPGILCACGARLKVAV